MLEVSLLGVGTGSVVNGHTTKVGRRNGHPHPRAQFSVTNTPGLTKERSDAAMVSALGSENHPEPPSRSIHHVFNGDMLSSSFIRVSRSFSSLQSPVDKRKQKRGGIDVIQEARPGNIPENKPPHWRPGNIFSAPHLFKTCNIYTHNDEAHETKMTTN